MFVDFPLQHKNLELVTGRRPFSMCSDMFLFVCSKISVLLHIRVHFAGPLREHVCEHLKNTFFKDSSRARCLFIAFGRVHSYVFGNVHVISYIRIYFARKHREHVIDRLKNTFFKDSSGARCLFSLLSDVVMVMCSEMWLLFHIFIYVLPGSIASMSANILKHVFQR